jgi:hypothetical protein
MRSGILRIAGWGLAAGLVVLFARSIAYAVSPSPLAAGLRAQAGGPRLPVVALVSLALALGLSSACLWLASLAVRERRLLEPGPFEVPRLEPGRLVVRATGLFLVTSLLFALVESYVHWRAGLGWHGLQCLAGPAHRDAVPLLAAFSLLAAAAAAALEHVLRWMGRTIARLLARLPVERPSHLVPAPRAERASGRLSVAGHGARAPPLVLA